MQGCSFHSFSKGCMIATSSLYRGEIRLLSRDEVVEERRQLTRLINEDAFFPLKSWPKETRLIFWEKNQWLIPKRSSWFSFSSVTVVSQALLGDGQCWRGTGRNQRLKQKRGQDKSILSSTVPTRTAICGSTLM